VSKKKKLTDYQKFFTAYRKICSKACLKVSSYNYEIFKVLYLAQDGGNCLKFYDVWISSNSVCCKFQYIWTIFKRVMAKNTL